MLPVHKLGPDLIFDRSIRDSMAENVEFRGKVIFSPKLFKASDLDLILVQQEVPLDFLFRWGKVATEAKMRFTVN